MKCPNCEADITNVGLSYEEATVEMNGKYFDVAGWTCNNCDSLIDLLT